jgi:hypothetical protein
MTELEQVDIIKQAVSKSDMSKIAHVLGEDVIALLRASIDRGTIHASIDLAEEWIAAAEQEIYNLQEKVKRLERECISG